jgi:hypothetical protein
VLVHPDDLAGVHEPDIARLVADESTQDRLVADEDEGVRWMSARELEHARDDLGGTVIAAHGVDRDPDPDRRVNLGWF